MNKFDAKDYDFLYRKMLKCFYHGLARLCAIVLPPFTGQRSKSCRFDPVYIALTLQKTPGLDPGIKKETGLIILAILVVNSTVITIFKPDWSARLPSPGGQGYRHRFRVASAEQSLVAKACAV